MQNYELIEKIGQGGMGHVWRARHKGLERDVAIKFMDAMFAQDPIALERFLREARLLAKVDHPNVVRVYDMGVDEKNQPFIAMELLSGVELSDQLRKGPLSEADSVHVASQVLLALEEAHKNGIIHRDIKSSNIMLMPNRTVKLLDFGIARDAMLSSVTSTGKVIGTPAYMSPEQAEGMPASPQSDLYSVGIVIYEMLMGVVPFRGETPLSVLRMQADAKPPELPYSFSPHIRQTVATALEKRAERRYPTARAMLDALNARAPSAVAPPPPMTPYPQAAGPTNPGGPPMATPPPGSMATPAYMQPPANRETRTSWTMGIIAIITAICAPIGFIFGLIGMIFGIKGKSKGHKGALGAVSLNVLAIAASVFVAYYAWKTMAPAINDVVPGATVQITATAYNVTKATNDIEKTTELGKLDLVNALLPNRLLTRTQVLDSIDRYKRGQAVEKKIDDREDAQIMQLLKEMHDSAGTSTSATAFVDKYEKAIGNPQVQGSNTQKCRALRDQYYDIVSKYLNFLLDRSGKYSLVNGGTAFQFAYGVEQNELDGFNQLTVDLSKVYQDRLTAEQARTDAVNDVVSSSSD